MLPERLTDLIPRICHCRMARALRVEQLDDGRAVLHFDPNRCEQLPATFDKGTLLSLADAAMFVALVGSGNASAQTRTAQVRLRSFEFPLALPLVLETRVTTLSGGLGCTEATIRTFGTGNQLGRVIAHASGTYRIPSGTHAVAPS
jgi:acyl-coenzyme A thioesterase PaaI-like protein